MELKISKEKAIELAESIKNYPKLAIYRNEANTRKRIIEPLIGLLGWDSLNEVALEYSISYGTSTNFVDYAFLLEDKPTVFLEAKPFDEELSSKHCNQVISYGKVEDVKWVALSNGRILKVFNTQKGKTEKECLVLDINLEDLPRQIDDLNLFSKTSILSGEIENAVKRMMSMKNAVKAIKENRAKLEKEFKTNLLDVTGSEIEKFIEKIANQLVDQALILIEKPHEEIGLTKTEEVQIIMKTELQKYPPGEVIICPSQPDGVDFLRKYNAWGYVNISSTRKPIYFALYVSSPISKILYFGVIDSISEPIKSKEELDEIMDDDLDMFKEGKRIIYLKPNSIIELSNPIPLGENPSALRSLRYTTLKNLINANTIDDI